MKWGSLFIAVLAGLSTLFFAAFGWFSLIREWKMALVCLIFAIIGGGVAFIYASIKNLEPY